jgi:hypothetical protein
MFADLDAAPALCRVSAAEAELLFSPRRPIVLLRRGDASVAVSVAPGQTKAVRFPLPAAPWPLPAGFHTLGVVVAEDAGEVWTRETPLGPQAGR